ncbi:cadherin-like domain-containing protein, partial [Aphanothece sacrum]|uniref:cadherin-like domain-containing protein n=1 Tax=Aphanothece sacrum TaxID=1122 RepID=UPI000F623F99
TGSAPSLTLEATNPFGLTDVADYATPTFADIDGDGDLDAFVGELFGNTIFYRNTGTGSAPSFTLEATNPFGLTDVGYLATPTFADIDGDGDLDAFVGTVEGNTLFFENIAPTTPVNNAPTGSPTATLSNTNEDTPITITAADLLAGFSDVDAGDTLSVVGLTSNNGTLVDNGNGTYTFTPTANFNGAVNLTYGVSDGTATLAGQSQTFSVTPVNDAPVGSPTATLSNTAEDTAIIINTADLLAGFSDVDGDNLSFVNLTADNGALVDNFDGTYTFTPTANFNGTVTLTYGVTDGTVTLAGQSQTFSVTAVNDAPTGDTIFKSSQTNPLGLTNVGFRAAPTFADIDGDGDLDAFVGELLGNTIFYRNTGTGSAPSFTLEATNPFGLTDVGYLATPTFADIDGDGDLDAFVGERFGNTVFYRNTGTGSAPSFTLEATNPFGLTDVVGYSTPTFADIDGDGDLDAFVGELLGNTVFYRNTGTGSAPSFTLEATNPFGLTDVGYVATPTFADIDGDGDLDAFVGERFGNTTFYRNTGTGSAPSFTLEATNPFGLTDVGYVATPTFADIDGDGDLDAFVGERFGNTLFFENISGVKATLSDTAEDTAIIIYAADLLAGFSDVDGDTLSVVGLTSNNGTLVDNGNGTYTFTPTANFNGTVTLTYGVTDGTVTLAGQSQTFSVTPVNDAPVGSPTATLSNTAEDTAITITAANLLAGFSDVEGDTISVVNLTADNGALVDNFDGTYTFTPTANFNGTVTLTYGVTDGTATLAGQTQTFSVTAVNDAPTGDPIFNSPQTNPFGLTDVGYNSAPTFADIDGDGDLDAFVGERYGNTVFYRNTGTGSAPSFTLEATNPFGLTDVGNNSAPTFADIDGDGDLDAFVGELFGNTRFYRNTGTGSAPSFTLEATNPFGLTDVGNNSAPTFADIDGDGDFDAFVGNSYGNTIFYRNTGTGSAPNFTLEATNPFGLTDVGILAKPTFADIDGDGDLDAFVGELFGNTIFYRNTGTGSAPNFTLEATNPFGLTDVGYVATPTFADIDGDGDLDAFVGETFGNTLFFENISGVKATLSDTAEDTAIIIYAADLLAGFSDLDGDTLSVVGLTSNNGTLVDNGNGTYTFTPTANFNGTVTLTYGVSDGTATLAGQSQTFSVTPVNDAPVGSPTATLSNTAEDTPITITAANLLAGFSDVDSDTLSVVGLTSNNGALVNNGNGTYTFTPTVNFNGTVTLTYGVSDGTATLAGQSQTFSVTPVNDAPVGSPTATLSNTAEDTPITITAANLLAGFSDVDGNTISVVNLTANNGALVNNGNGTYTFTPTANFNGAVNLTYGVSDGTATLAGQSQTFSVTPVNDAPVGSPTATLSNTAEDTPITITAANLLAGFSDVDGNTISVVNLTANNGALVNNGNGTYTFTPTANFNGAVNLTYGVTDGTATLAGQSQTFSVTPVNDAPVGVNDTATTAFNTAVTIQASTLLANDTDVDNSVLSITGVSGVTNGTAVLNNNGTVSNTADDYIVFTPTTGFSGNASFNYTLSDGSLTGTAAVTVAVGSSITGTNQSDNLVGGNGNDILNGGNGNDTIYGGNGNDILDGGNSNDTLYGGSGNDTLLGGNGDDLLYGDGFLNGGIGNDVLNGDNGKDTLYGGLGSDTLTGGNAQDVFAYTGGDGSDTITDFVKGQDKIGLYNGLSFGQLNFSGNTIRVASTNEILATLTGINTTTLTAADFVNI